MITAVIFDIDGTLIDSVDLHGEAWRVARFGKKVTFEEVHRQIGKGGDQLMPVFLSLKELAKFGEELEQFRGDLCKKEFLPRVNAFPGVRQLFPLSVSTPFPPWRGSLSARAPPGIGHKPVLITLVFSREGRNLMPKHPHPTDCQNDWYRYRQRDPSKAERSEVIVSIQTARTQRARTKNA